MKTFDDLIGQSAVKRQLSYYLDVRKSGGNTPFIIANGEKGAGKTEFLTRFAKAEDKPLLTINCATIKNIESFASQIFCPIIEHNDINVLFDECHNLKMDIQEQFLSIFGSVGKNGGELRVGESVLSFDFRKQLYLFATTELDKMSLPLKDRLTLVSFAEYEEEELQEITAKLSKVPLKTNVSHFLRGNPRSAVKLAADINAYCALNKIREMNNPAFVRMRAILNILPLGINAVELQILRTLQKRKKCSLTMLSAVTGLSANSLRKDAEVYLLKKGLMAIEGQRYVTQKGINLLKSL